MERIWTVGHSTRALEDFVELLRAHAITRLADVRTIPRSRRHPQFNRETLPGSLAAAGIGYVHLAALGGWRRPRADSINTAWRNESFRGYADHMQTPEFETALPGLIALAAVDRVAIMCAEAVRWRCHRSLIADALVARGVGVEHIESVSRAVAHTLTPFAHVREGRVTYPGTQGRLRL
ncbi:MAG TPA: DUF488 domain-containing protein [Methylomirabilota bacterium]